MIIIIYIIFILHVHTNLNVDFVPRNCLQNLELGSLDVQTEMFFVIICDFVIIDLVFIISHLFSEIPEIIDCAIACCQDQAVEWKALDVVRLRASFQKEQIKNNHIIKLSIFHLHSGQPVHQPG